MMFLIQNNHKIFGIGCILIAQFLFSIQDMAIKLLSPKYPLHQIIFVESSVAFLLTSLVFVPLEGGLKNLITNRIGIHIIRGFGIVIVDVCFFTAMFQCHFLM